MKENIKEQGGEGGGHQIFYFSVMFNCSRYSENFFSCVLHDNGGESNCAIAWCSIHWVLI